MLISNKLCGSSVWNLASLAAGRWGQTGIAGDNFLSAGGTTIQHHTSCTVVILRFDKPWGEIDLMHSLLQSRIVLQVTTNGFAHHGVFTHQHHGFSTQRHTDGLHLLGAHVVCPHNEAFWKIIQKLLRKKRAVKKNLNWEHFAISWSDLVRSHDTYDDFHKIIGLPRGPVFPGHLDSASKDRLTAGLKTRLDLEPENRMRCKHAFDTE